MPFTPGGGTDIQARLLGRKFTEFTGQPFVVDNRPGAGGLIGAELVVKAPPDGHTVLITSTSIAINVSLQKKLAFDPLKDLQPVSLLTTGPYLLAVHPSMPVRSVKELIALAKRSPAPMNSASSGAGTAPHLTLELFKRKAGVPVTHVPYKGGAAAIQALITGEVDFEFVSAFTAGPFVKSGRVRVLAISSNKRSSNFPAVPTVAEAGVPGFESYNWTAAFLPAGASKEVTGRLHGILVKGLNSPELQEYVKTESGSSIGSTPDEFAAYFRRVVATYAQVIREGNIKAD